jgi:hypothetical protein
MALTNLILTVVGVGAAVMLLRKDVKQSSTMLRRNLRHIKTWLEEESTAATYALHPFYSLQSFRVVLDGIGIIGLDLTVNQVALQFPSVVTQQ